MIKFVKEMTKELLRWAIIIFCWPYLLIDGCLHAEEYIGLSNIEAGNAFLRRNGLDWLCVDEES